MSLSLPKTCAMGDSKTGLVGTIGVALLNPDGTVHTARATAGIYEIGGGCYGKEITFPDNWKGSIKWDTGGGSPVYATEDYDVEGLIDMIEEDTSKMNFTGDDIKATLDGEKVALSDATETQIDDIENATIIARATINDATPSTTKFITTLTETANTFWPRAALLMTSGQNKGQIRGIKTYNGSTKEIQIQTPLSYTPANGDKLIILPARKFLTPDIVEFREEMDANSTKLASIIGLVHENIYIDQPSYDANKNLISARLRIYSVAGSVGTDNDVLATYTITAVGDGEGKFISWKQVKQ